ncbi:MAG: choloylglycine hydrolase family protein [Lachnospiraceae bacterium]|jgi:penicillin V acylase-like amidase (Ntn superfamily)|nr:choloylglycine hydrolase family protein [Lachnospiraceae bacterium]
MCTAATYKTRNFYFGRTLDYEFSYGEEVTVTPRNYPFYFREMGCMARHYAVIGMAHISQGYPLYYDGVNEKGLAMAGLNFVGNACYRPYVNGRENVAVFELIPWLLGSCATVKECRKKISKLNIINPPFNDALPVPELHWIIADKEEAVTLEAVAEGIFLYDNPVGVLTNNPVFPKQMFQLNNYMNLSPKPPKNHFAQGLPLTAYSQGMGALGLPGDLSSQSRFVRASFVKMNSVSGDSEKESVGQFFHILGSVEQQNGCCEIGEGQYAKTIYTSCCNAESGIYYYTTYQNRQITAVDMHREDIDERRLFHYPLICQEQIRMQN